MEPGQLRLYSPIFLQFYPLIFLYVLHSPLLVSISLLFFVFVSLCRAIWRYSHSVSFSQVLRRCHKPCGVSSDKVSMEFRWRCLIKAKCSWWYESDSQWIFFGWTTWAQEVETYSTIQISYLSFATHLLRVGRLRMRMIVKVMEFNDAMIVANLSIISVS